MENLSFNLLKSSNDPKGVLTSGGNLALYLHIKAVDRSENANNPLYL